MTVDLDDPTTVVHYLREMAQAGNQAHTAAAEDNDRTGAIRDIIFGINTIVDSVISLASGQP